MQRRNGDVVVREIVEYLCLFQMQSSVLQVAELGAFYDVVLEVDIL